MSAKLAKLIKEARTNAGLSQQALADMIPGLSATEISKAERNEKEPTQDEIKAIAKACGVTQKSLLEAASKKTTAKTTTAKTTTAKTESAKKNTTAKKETTKKTTTTTSKTTTASKSGTSTTSVKLTAAEKKLVELYRKADSDAKKAALKALKDEESEINDLLSSILEGAVGAFLK